MRIDLTENWELTGSYPGFWAFGRSMEVGVQLKGIVLGCRPKCPAAYIGICNARAICPTRITARTRRLANG